MLGAPRRRRRSQEARHPGHPRRTRLGGSSQPCNPSSSGPTRGPHGRAAREVLWLRRNLCRDLPSLPARRAAGPPAAFPSEGSAKAGRKPSPLSRAPRKRYRSRAGTGSGCSRQQRAAGSGAPRSAGRASLSRPAAPLRLGVAGCGLGTAHGAREAGPVTPDAHGRP